MDHIIVAGIPYAQLLEDVRALIRTEMQQHVTLAAVVTTPPLEQLLTVQQAATLLDVCPATLHEWKKRGVVPYHKLGRRTYFKEPDLLAALQRYQRTGKKSRQRRE